jgi:hypothetical protein
VGYGLSQMRAQARCANGCSKMKKALLAGAAALLMATSQANADTSLSPTDPLIGEWCVKGSFYKRGSCKTSASDLDELMINRYGYRGNAESSCTFLEIKRMPGGIEAFLECHGDGGTYTHEKATFQIFGNRLKMRVTVIHTAELEFLKPFCFSIRETPAGYLNLRQGPGTNFKVKAKLIPFQNVRARFKTKEWTRITVLPDETLSGWVYSKYVEESNDEAYCTRK